MLNALQLDALPVDKTNRDGAASMAQQVAQKSVMVSSSTTQAAVPRPSLHSQPASPQGCSSLHTHLAAFSSISPASFPFLCLLRNVIYSHCIAAPISEVPQQWGPCATAVLRASLILVALSATSSRCFVVGAGEDGCTTGSCFALSIDNQKCHCYPAFN